MRSVTYSPILKKDQARMARRGKDSEKFVNAVFILATKGSLPVQYGAHKLRGEYAGHWECHLYHPQLTPSHFAKNIGYNFKKNFQ